MYWVDIQLAQRKGLKFHQTRSNAIILNDTLPAYCIPKVVVVEPGEVIYEKVYASPRPPPKISLKHEWTRELGSKVARQPEGEVVRQSRGEVSRQAKFSQPSQPIPKPICDRSGQPDNTQDVLVVKGETSPFHEIDEKRFARRTLFFRIDQGNCCDGIWRGHIRESVCVTSTTADDVL